MISGLYLSIVRPFKIGDKITISNALELYLILKLYTKLLTENGDIVIVPRLFDVKQQYASKKHLID